ncbi:cytochrome P450 [Cylindrobasidium torrendii FP15055 ss-10]|uniref:Cytochrome P450 n=1 Tax=Cylindrobasidium torrendii FP15055 ss-10 TaxID=1314674 RepID=A0A0D7BIC6_9AGAR|nr:cytochrome P450 [Cylindrobasidium torrendii FP15055 ss-10]
MYSLSTLSLSPTMSLSSSIAYLLLPAITVSVLLHLWSARKTLNKPPGPRGLPLVGNIFDMPKGRPWEGFAEMSKKYGPMISLTIGPTTIIVVNTFGKTKELFDKKGSVYPSRPTMYMCGELMGWKKSAGMLEYGKAFVQTRKMYHQELGSMGSIRTFYPQEEDQAKRFLDLIIEDPDHLVEHCFQHASALILRIAYGYTAKKHGDEITAKTKEAMHTFDLAMQQGFDGFLVNQIPQLARLPNWFPGTDFKRIAREWAPLYIDMIDVPLNYTRQQLKEGTAEHSFAARWLRRDLPPEEDEILRHGAGALAGAGSETTAITVHAFFTLMAIYPDIQKRAQAEVDEIIGRGNLPTFAERERLPFLNTVIKETIRIHPSVRLALPHTTTQDDIHDGYFIPKGSMILSNAWAMAHDPQTYPNPFEFNPDRFMGDTPNRDPFDYIFGIGRRICPGRLLADASLFITCAMSIATFDIAPGKDKNGKPVVVSLEPTPGLLSWLKPFPLEIKPRFVEDKL